MAYTLTKHFFKKDNKDILRFMIVINDLYYLHDDTSSCKFKNNVKFTTYEKSIYKPNTDLSPLQIISNIWNEHDNN